MAENIYELFPLFPHHIFYPVCLCVVRNKSLREGWGGEGKKAVQGLGIHQVPGTLVVPGLGVPWPQAGLLLSEVPPHLPAQRRPATQRKSFGGRVSNANTEGINIFLSLWFLSHPLHSHQSRKFNSNGFMTWVPLAKRDH